MEDLVVALGGGALVDDDNWAFAREHGRVVYLEVDSDTILSRVADEADRRPLLQDDEGEPLSEERMRTRVEELLSTRESRYEAAHATVDATGTVAEVTQAVFEEARARGWE